jgi:hypothetical protein
LPELSFSHTLRENQVIELPAEVDASNIRSSFNDGVLEIVIPKVGKVASGRTPASTNTDIALPPDLPPEEYDRES